MQKVSRSFVFKSSQVTIDEESKNILDDTQDEDEIL